MDAYNPYAPPADPTQAPQGGPHATAATVGFHRQGDELVVDKNAMLPDVCIVTGQPTGGRTQTDTAQWIPPWTIIVMVFIRLVGLILMMVMRKTGKFTYHWSEEARKKRKQGVAIGLGIVGLSVLMFIGGVMAGDARMGEGVVLGLIFGGLIAFFVGLITAIVMGRPYQVKKIDEHHIYLKVKPEFWTGLQQAGITPGTKFG